MKKLFLLAIVALLAFCTVVYAEEEVAEPEVAETEEFIDEVSYKATVTGTGEIVYYIPSNGQNVVGGKLNAGDQIEIYYEEERDDGSLLFYFITPSETAQSKWNSIKKIDKKNIIADTKGEGINKYNISRQATKIVVMHYLGLSVYKYPGFCFEEVQHLKQGTKLKVYHLDYYRDGLWYYADEVNGYVHLTEGLTGFSTGLELITPTSVKLYKTTDLNEDEIILELEPGLQFADLVKMGDNCYYMSAYERDGFVRASDLATKSNGEKSTIWYENAKLYKEASFTSKVLVSDIPLNTEIKWEYNTDLSKYGWVRTTYKDQIGWVYVVNPQFVDDDSDEAATIREEYFENIRLGEEMAASAGTSKPASGDKKGGQTTTPAKEEPTVVPDEVNPGDGEDVVPIVAEPKEGLPLQTVIIISCCATIFVLVLIIVLLTKKNAWYRRRYRKGKW